MQSLDAFHLLDDRSPYRVACSVAAYAQINGFDRTHTWRWLTQQRPEYTSLSSVFPGIWSRTSSVVSLPGGVDPAQHARRTVAHILRETVRPTKSTPAAKRVVAVVGGMLLSPKRSPQSGKDEIYRAVQVSALTLGAKTGVRTAKPAMTKAREYKMLSFQSRRAHAPIIKLARVPASFEWTPVLWDAVDALKQRESSTMLSALVLSASHPAWDSLGASTWLEACTLAVPGRDSLLGRSSSRAARALLEQWEYPLLDVTQLDTWLERVASESGAAETRAEMVRRRTEEAEERAAAAEQVRRIRAMIPKAPDNATHLSPYFEAMLRLGAEHPDMQSEVRRTMLRRVAKRHDGAEQLWLRWLVAMWCEKAPVHTDDVDKERKRRRAVASAVVRALADTTTPMNWQEELTHPTAIQTAKSGVEWCSRKNMKDTPRHEDRSRTSNS